jgi:SpoU rRNA methylase family enzyme
VPAPDETARAIVERSRTAADGAGDAPWIEVAEVEPLAGAGEGYLVSGLPISKDDDRSSDPVVFRVAFVGTDGERTAAVEAAPVVAKKNAFLLKKTPLAIVCVIVSASVLAWILLARAGRSVKIRRIAALEAIDEAVGRATEMGRPVLFVPGIMDMNDIQTVAGVTILGRVAKTAAEYDARLEVPTARSMVMTSARETVQAAHFAAGRPETYDEASIRYITDEQFGYVAYVAGRMVREKPAACFYMGCFYAESLVLAENGNSIGAIQVAGTAEASQLPFFVAACDYTLIGEEFYAASAYLSGERDQLGSIKGQDVGKLLVAAVIVASVVLATLAAFWPSGGIAGASTAFRAFFGD